MGLALALASLGCGGTRGTSSSEIPTPAVHEMARLQKMGRLDPARLACSAVTLDIVARELGPHVPALAYAAPRPVVAEPSSHARSVQQEMAASDFRNMAARYASTQRVVAAQATQAGDNDRAALAGSYVARALRAASMSGADPVRLEERPIGWSQADAELLVEYTSLWSTGGKRARQGQPDRPGVSAHHGGVCQPVTVHLPGPRARVRSIGMNLVITQIDPDTLEARWCLDRYFEELGQRFEEGFDVDRSLNPDLDDFRPPHGTFLICHAAGAPIGCGAVTLASEDTAYIKRMWVHESTRGAGVGRRLLGALEEAGWALGCRAVQLETNRSLREAQRLYRSAGYEEVAPFNEEPYAHHWFRKTLDQEG
jgi:GNAT superfamily N-acetyltransferase